MNALVNHLWQSTVFALALGLLALALRSNRAAIRHRLWLAASLKFLIPFSLLTGWAGQLAWSPVTSPIATRPVAAAIAPVSAVFDPLPLTPSPAPIPRWPLAVLWLAGTAAIAFSWTRRWYTLRRAHLASTPAPIPSPLPIRITPARVEPGVFGVFRPVLLLPEGLAATLPPEQLSAILDHELCHVRRRDNLAGLLQMLVQALFWFHPLVWWIGARLIEERERACDEEVLRLGNSPEAYAEGILSVCSFCLPSALPCAPGVTGAGLRRRVFEIMRSPVLRPISAGRKMLMAAMAAAALLAPVLVGVLQAQGPLAFDVATIKPANPEERNSRFNIVPGGGINVVNVPLRRLVEFALDLRETQLIGAPAWADKTSYDIVGRVGTPDAPTEFGKLGDRDRAALESKIRQRTLALLEDRFQFKFHRETREMPILALVAAKGGLKITATPEGDTRPPNMRMGPGSLTAQRMPLKLVANALSRLLAQTVVDQTGAAGNFDFELKWAPDDAAAGAEGPSIYSALQEQAGLRLESRRAPVDVVVVDRIEKPSEN